MIESVEAWKERPFELVESELPSRTRLYVAAECGNSSAILFLLESGVVCVTCAEIEIVVTLDT